MPSPAQSARAVAAVFGTGVTLVVTFYVWMLTRTYAIHFCGWPAYLQCGTGSRIWWLVPAGVAAVAVVASAGLAAWARVGRHGILAWLPVLWLVVFPVGGMSRRFSTTSLVFYGPYVLVLIVLLAVQGSSWFPTRERAFTGAGVVALVLYAAVLLWLPGHLRSFPGS